MAFQPEVRYINQYVSGTMAYQPERKPSRKYTATLPKPRQKKQEMILVDPVAVVGIVVAIALMVTLLVGAVQLYGTLHLRDAGLLNGDTIWRRFGTLLRPWE